MMKTVAGAKAQRETAVGASRRLVTLCENHFGAVWLKLSKPCRAPRKGLMRDAFFRISSGGTAIISPRRFFAVGFLFFLQVM
jgi:hypothetical protein